MEPSSTLADCFPNRTASMKTSGVIDATQDHNTIEVESNKKLPSSKYKGVVSQPNGRWGAQIYVKHQRVWLGTFNHQHQAARAYDVASTRFHGGRGSLTRFNLHAISNQSKEYHFIMSRPKAEIVDLLRKHTYDHELKTINKGIITKPAKIVFLFEKVVTPSDVGKLNRLVIPKQYAEKHLPPMTSPSHAGVTSSKEVLLNLEDCVNGRVWRFRYSYWKSSQSYVLSKGWNMFVKERKLKRGDLVVFKKSVGSLDGRLYIDCKPGSGGNGGRPVAGEVRPTRWLRLFGVDICKVVDGGNGMKTV